MAVILALLVVVVVAVVVRFAPRHSAKPVAAAAAKSKAKAGAAGKAKANPEPGGGKPLAADVAAGTVAPAGATCTVPPCGVRDPLADRSGTEKHDVDPFSAGGFPTLTAPSCPPPKVIEHRRVEVAPPPSADLLGIRPAKPAPLLRGGGGLPATNRSHGLAARAEPSPKRDDRDSLRTVPPPPPKPDRPRRRDWGGDASLGGQPPAPPVHRERGRYEDFETEGAGALGRSSYRDVTPPREPSYQASAAGMRRESRAGRSYTVAAGETLFTIARYELGKASRWVEIFELNSDTLGTDFNNLKPGTKLLLPANERTDVLAEPSNGVYRR